MLSGQELQRQARGAVAHNVATVFAEAALCAASNGWRPRQGATFVLLAHDGRAQGIT